MYRTLVAFIFVLLAFPHAALAGTDQQAVDALNEARRQIGVAPVTVNPLLTLGCQKHVNYMKMTGTISHSEDILSPYYTIIGDLAAKRAVLAKSPLFASTGYVSATTNPWGPLGAPLHLFQLLHPALKETGYADLDGNFCMSTLDSLDPLLGSGKVFNYPANGQIEFATSENTQFEFPNPTQLFGLAPNATTGPYLFVYAQGFNTLSPIFGTTFSDVQVVGPEGSVQVLYKDGTGTVTDQGNGSFSYQTPSKGGYIVPVKPLKTGSKYTVSLKITGLGPGSTSVNHTWSFVTSGTASPITSPIASTSPGAGKAPICKVFKSVKKIGKTKAYIFKPLAGCKQLGYSRYSLEVKVGKAWKLQKGFVTRAKAKSPWRIKAVNKGAKKLIAQGKL